VNRHVPLLERSCSSCEDRLKLVLIILCDLVECCVEIDRSEPGACVNPDEPHLHAERISVRPHLAKPSSRAVGRFEQGRAFVPRGKEARIALRDPDCLLKRQRIVRRKLVGHALQIETDRLIDPGERQPADDGKPQGQVLA
jgi:hypothetical protein